MEADVTSGDITHKLLELERNDISRLEVKKVVATSESTDALIFQRIEAPIDVIEERITPELTHFERLLTPAKASSISSLEFELGERLGVGFSGLIYEISNPKLSSDDGKVIPVHLPPLVAKFAARKRNKYMAREAWFYDEMQTIQGVAIPRCYGWFEATLPEGQQFIPWQQDPVKRDIWDDDDPLDESIFTYLYKGKFNDSGRPLLTELGNDRTVTLLILERLGDPFLPLRIPLSADIQQEVKDVYKELARLHIEHSHVGFLQILKAPEYDASLPGIPSQTTGKVYGCRITNFEFSRKLLLGETVVHNIMVSDVKRLLHGLPMGVINDQTL